MFISSQVQSYSEWHLCCCAAKYSKSPNLKLETIYVSYPVTLKKQQQHNRNWGSEAGIQASPLQTDVLATGCCCFMALTDLPSSSECISSKTFECKMPNALANPGIISLFCSENTCLLNSPAAVSESSSVSSEPGGRLPTPKLRALGRAQRTHHDLTTPAVGNRDFWIQNQELKKNRYIWINLASFFFF